MYAFKYTTRALTMSPEFMLVTFVLFLAGSIAVPIASRLGLGSVLGYLIAGIIISPMFTVMGVDVAALQHFAEFGIVMMLFLIGLEMQPRELWLMRNKIFVMGGLQISLTTILVMTISMSFGYVWSMSLTIGLIFALSSTAIVNQTLIEKRLSKSMGGRCSLAVLLAQDITVIPILIMLPLLATPDLIELVLIELLELTDVNQQDYHVTVNTVSLVEGLNGWQATVVTFMAVGGVIVLGKFAVTPLFRFVAQARLRELFLSTALLVVVGIALLMTLVGLPSALGAFLAGVVLASSEYKHELENNIDPYRGLLLGLFFITIGAGINFGLLFNSFTIIISLTVGLIVLKSVVLLLLTVIYKLQGTDRWLFSLGLAQAGEFGLVLVTLSVTKAVLPRELADSLILIVTLSMLLTPMVFLIYEKFIAPSKNKAPKQKTNNIDKEI